MDLLQGLRWDLICDGIQMLLGVAVLGAVIARSWTDKRRRAEARSAARPLSFGQEVLLQALRQQTRQALDAILAAVEAERSKLQPLLDAEPPCQPAETVPVEHAPFRLGEDNFHSGALTEPNPYAAIRELDAGGLSARQIAEQIQRPAGEVELALRLQRRAS